MNRRSFFRTALAPFGAMALMTALAIPAHARIPLAELSRYLNALTTAQAEFTQINADGTISTGKIYIQRPGRVRFEYAPPDRNLVIAGSGTVAIFDAKSNQAAEQYPLSRTPLSIILAQNVDLGRARMVTDHREDGNTTRVRAQDPDNPNYGSIDLIFTADPTELRQWVIRDDSGQETTVILGEMTKGARLENALFNINFELERRSNR
ncbi:outer membrane lipoprotein carrier protein LolA [Szabonella alba]|uniref:Outer membrane lipoprotein carrier protein LolA n=1 Tax=Szabonella alba TaxID=2804194 RepID=A0A8K0XZC1_9RHOB|nr:outer membrane lipoprotein carrier protein LolA [Szabonella alba]